MSKPMNNHEAWLQVEAYFRDRIGKRGAVDDNSLCYYRMATETEIIKCAVGCLIPDEIYTTSIEQLVADEATQFNMPIMEYFEHVDAEFLIDLQTAHDRGVGDASGIFTQEVFDEMKKVATDYKAI